MKIVLEFNEEDDKMYIDYIKKLDREEKRELKNEAKWAIYEHINEQFEREKREIEREKKWEKQRNCKHYFEVIGRSYHDEDGQAYVDEDGICSSIELVKYRCKNCDKYKSEFHGREW